MRTASAHARRGLNHLGRYGDLIRDQCPSVADAIEACGQTHITARLLASGCDVDNPKDVIRYVARGHGVPRRRAGRPPNRLECKAFIVGFVDVLVGAGHAPAAAKRIAAAALRLTRNEVRNALKTYPDTLSDLFEAHGANWDTHQAELALNAAARSVAVAYVPEIETRVGSQN